MDVTPLIPQGRQIIQSYSPAGFKVNGALHTGAVIVFPEITQDWNVQKFEQLDESSFSVLIDKASDLDVVLLGTGAATKFFSPAFKNALKAKGLQVEAMDSSAACRTYNVLMAEGRRVAAALLPVT